MDKSEREVRLESGGSVSMTSTPPRERYSREAGKGKQGEVEDDE
jgi:hypothetical protein